MEGFSSGFYFEFIFFGAWLYPIVFPFFNHDEQNGKVGTSIRVKLVHRLILPHLIWTMVSRLGETAQNMTFGGLINGGCLIDLSVTNLESGNESR